MLRKSVADVGLHKSSFQEAQTSIHRGSFKSLQNMINYIHKKYTKRVVLKGT